MKSVKLGEVMDESASEDSSDDAAFDGGDDEEEDEEEEEDAWGRYEGDSKERYCMFGRMIKKSAAIILTACMRVDRQFEF